MTSNVYKVDVPIAEERGHVDWIVSNGMSVPSIWSPVGRRTLIINSKTYEGDALLKLRFPTLECISLGRR